MILQSGENLYVDEELHFSITQISADICAEEVAA